MDTLFFLHTFENIPHAIPIFQDIYLNGDFHIVRQRIAQGGSIKGKLRFFVGYAGWGYRQLEEEIAENTWMISNENATILMDENNSPQLWKNTLKKMGDKYEIWSHFPQVPSLN